ncbi:MAG: ROK family protein [Planctomycetota bacterium]|nr:ROK family protein [Planctomycetota bacterium]
MSDVQPLSAQSPEDRAPGRPLAGGIEAGGTKFVCLVGSGPDHIVAETRFPTTTPAETLGRAIAFFAPYVGPGGLAALGLACFGPVDLNEASPTYGHITTTPKPGWAHSDMVGPFRRALGLPVAFESDVNAAAMGEYYWVADNRRCSPLVYFTVGTGIGGGIVLAGKPVHGLVHPEAGHVRLPHDWQVDPFPGVCPYHGDCFEGLASGPAMRARWGCPAEELPAEHPAWDLEAAYMALAMANVICTLSPQRIVLGGGVMQQGHLLPMVRQKVAQVLNGYIQSPALLAQMDAYIVPPALGQRSGVLGALALAQQACSAPPCPDRRRPG